jgi:NAD(P)-dependent dehydrogenase (short-subunit alcohol dehydrogenase family)
MSMSGKKVLAGKTALVSGGSGGIGSASARFLAQDGAAVLLMGRREDALVRTRAALLEQVPDARIEIFAGDAVAEADVKEALKQAHALQGRLDILVPTVGGGGFKPLLLQEAEGFVREFELNVVSVFHMVKHGVPLMEPGGSIVCISSTAGTLPFPGLAAYSTTKAALEMFIKVAADELGSAKIRINGVRPGLTRSEATTGMYANADLLSLFVAEMPIGRAGEADDIGQAVRYLAGPESSWVTGQSFAADGGQELRKNPDLSHMIDMMFGKDVMDKVRAGKPPA